MWKRTQQDCSDAKTKGALITAWAKGHPEKVKAEVPPHRQLHLFFVLCPSSYNGPCSGVRFIWESYIVRSVVCIFQCCFPAWRLASIRHPFPVSECMCSRVHGNNELTDCLLSPLPPLHSVTWLLNPAQLRLPRGSPRSLLCEAAPGEAGAWPRHGRPRGNLSGAAASFPRRSILRNVASLTVMQEGVCGFRCSFLHSTTERTTVIRM